MNAFSPLDVLVNIGSRELQILFGEYSYALLVFSLVLQARKKVNWWDYILHVSWHFAAFLLLLLFLGRLVCDRKEKRPRIQLLFTT